MSPTQPTTYAGSNWQRPQSNFGWAIIDGRYQLVPSEAGSQPGGGVSQNAQGYTPTQIGWNPTTGQTQLTSSSGAAAPADSTRYGVNAAGQQVPIHGAGEGPYADEPGTWTSTEGLGTLRADELQRAPDNYFNIPAQGEAFVTRHTGIDAQGNPYEQDVIVTDSSNAGGLGTPGSWNTGAVTPYGHLNEVSPLQGIQDTVGNIPIIGDFLGSRLDSLSSILPGRTPTELSSTNQLGQSASGLAGSWERQSDGTFGFTPSTPVVSTPAPSRSSDRDDGPSAAQQAASRAAAARSSLSSTQRQGGADLDRTYGISGLAQGGQVKPKSKYEAIKMKRSGGMR